MSPLDRWKTHKCQPAPCSKLKAWLQQNSLVAVITHPGVSSAHPGARGQMWFCGKSVAMSAHTATAGPVPLKYQQCWYQHCCSTLPSPKRFPSCPIRDGWWSCSHNNKPPRCKTLQYVRVQNINEIFILMRSTSCSLCCSHVCKSCRVYPRTTALHWKWREANWTGLVPWAQQIVGWRTIPQEKLQTFPCASGAQDSHPGVLLRQFTVRESSLWFGLVLLNFYFLNV